jgi:hypothetical protein
MYILIVSAFVYAKTNDVVSYRYTKGMSQGHRDVK